MNINKDTIAGYVQIMAIIALIVIIYIDVRNNGDVNFPNLIYAGVVGAAVGVDSKEFLKQLLDRWIKK